MSRSLVRVTKLVKVDGHAHQLLHLSEASSTRKIEVLIGATALEAIRCALLKDKSTRPLTSDLCTELVKKFGGEVHETEIVDFDNGTYFAELRLSDSSGAPLTLDCRPSDAISICLQLNAPIYVSENVWNKLLSN
ncbi:MAG: bifunctional nuclease family protein [Planctomycetota bacterium]|nr:bifunctional nuclease family protein [Planctomycetota bacterium]